MSRWLPLPIGGSGTRYSVKVIRPAFHAEHRATVRGDLALAMSLVRCLHIVEGYLCPDIMTRRILPHPAKRRASHVTAYVFLIFRTASLEGAAS